MAITLATLSQSYPKGTQWPIIQVPLPFGIGVIPTIQSVAHRILP
jgi:hypothetical protein